MALGKPIVVFAANVHGGERTFREGLLVLMRDLATPGTSANDMLDNVTVQVDEVQMGAVCVHDGKPYSAGAVRCMEGQRMRCKASEGWTQAGDC